MEHVCFSVKLAGFDIRLLQTNFNNFTVIYGKDVQQVLDYGTAARKLGEAIMHACACEGKLDGRTASEARQLGDRRPVFDESISKVEQTVRMTKAQRKAVKELEREQRIRYDDNGKPIIEIATCGTCGLKWNDAAISTYTPVPSGRCPFEFQHKGN